MSKEELWLRLRTWCMPMPKAKPCAVRNGASMALQQWWVWSWLRYCDVHGRPWSVKGSSNPPTQLVSIVLNTLPCKQKVDVARELMRREWKRWRNHARNYVSTKTKTKEARIEGRKEKKRYDWIAIFFKKPSIENVVSMSSLYMTWQV